MRKIIILLTFIVATLPLFAKDGNPKFKVIIFANTLDESIGNDVALQLEELNNWFDDVVGHAIDMTVDDEYSESFSGLRCCYDTLMRVLDSFRCDTNDIVVFWYLGHGIRSSRDTSRFPQMCLGEHDQRKFVPLESVKERIMQYRPRLCVVVGDCCNSLDENVQEKNDWVMANRASGTVNKKSTLDFVEKLFGEAEGCFTISASSAGEYGWSNPLLGFFFTHNFIDNSQHMQPKFIIDNQPWQSIMNQLLSHFSLKDFRARGDTTIYKMHPQYKFEPRHTFKKRVQYRYEIDNSLADALQYVIHDQTERRNKEVISKYFTDKSAIIVVGKNSSTILGVFTPEQYMTRLTSRPNLARTTIRAMYKDKDGKVSKVYVHEIYIDNEQ